MTEIEETQENEPNNNENENEEGKQHDHNPDTTHHSTTETRKLAPNIVTKSEAEKEPDAHEKAGLEEEDDDNDDEEDDFFDDDQDRYIFDDMGLFLAEAKRVLEEQTKAQAEAIVIQAAFEELSKLTGTDAKEQDDEQDRNRTTRAAQNERSSSTSTSTGRACTTRIWNAIRIFYQHHAELIKESHGMRHVEEVHAHACCAIDSFVSKVPPQNMKNHNGDNLSYLSETERMEIEVAALLHDVDDTKYFPQQEQHCDDDHTIDEKQMLRLLYPNAVQLMHDARIPATSYSPILFMIDLVSCSKNGNHVPECIITTGAYQFLIPRWSDRIEAVGARGVVRCYQYNHEHHLPLCTPGVSPRPTTVEELWTKYATPDRFEQYIRRGTNKKKELKNILDTDGAEIGRPNPATRDIPMDHSMIGHYYEKLLHVACPPKDSIRNEYLEDKLQNSAKELIEVCIRYGKTGRVDEDYICSLIP